MTHPVPGALSQYAGSGIVLRGEIMSKGNQIILVEDDTTMRENLHERLASEGYRVQSIADGEKGWALIQKEKPDMVILDIMLPGLDGLSICRMLRKDTTLMNTPVLMLTARSTEIDKIVGLETGADDYITKPFSLNEFVARVRARLRIEERIESAVQYQELISDDLRLNPGSRRAYLQDREVKLSNKEFDLLAELMRNRNVVLSRDLILTKVWGYDTFVDKRTVDVHIRWLREKIEQNPSSPRRITTMRGVGYRFEG
ncbi:MAG: response regulator transcription factor [Aggregatilineales bacterium]